METESRGFEDELFSDNLKMEKRLAELEQANAALRQQVEELQETHKRHFDRMTIAEGAIERASQAGHNLPNALKRIETMRKERDEQHAKAWHLEHELAALRERTRGLEEIAAERERQKSVEGWTEERDDGYGAGQLARAAACFAAPIPTRALTDLYAKEYHDVWPEDWNLSWTKEAKGHDRRRQLVIAGALIVAELDRLSRLVAAPAPQPDAATNLRGEVG